MSKICFVPSVAVGDRYSTIQIKSILNSKGLLLKISINDVFLSPILTNSANTDEMPPYVAFHLWLHCLPNYLFTGIQNEKG